jgi:hypothetical protein
METGATLAADGAWFARALKLVFAVGRRLAFAQLRYAASRAGESIWNGVSATQGGRIVSGAVCQGFLIPGTFRLIPQHIRRNRLVNEGKKRRVCLQTALHAKCRHASQANRQTVQPVY